MGLRTKAVLKKTSSRAQEPWSTPMAVSTKENGSKENATESGGLRKRAGKKAKCTTGSMGKWSVDRSKMKRRVWAGRAFRPILVARARAGIRALR